MATQKFSKIRLGPGSMNDLVGESEIFCETVDPTPSDGKNGDLWIKAGTQAKFYQKVNGAWVDVGSNPAPTTVALVDGQLTLADAITYAATQYPFALITYTIDRGASTSRRRTGFLVINSDSGSATLQNSEEITELGADVQVTFSTTILAGVVKVQYTSINEGVALTLKYTISGW